MVNRIKVVVTGAAGKMGQAVMRAVLEDGECALVGAVDVWKEGVDVGTLLGKDSLGIMVEPDLKHAIEEARPDVLVDFTSAKAALENAKTAIEEGVFPVIGTTGLTEQDLAEIKARCEQTGRGAFVAPNFAIGAVLMMQYAKNAAKYMPEVEIIELHHDQKVDAPSGTALRTADLIARNRDSTPVEKKAQEKVAGSRGGNFETIHIHSVRLPGLVAHQEVIFGGLGQILTIRHDSISRDSFLPGVMLAVKEAPRDRGLVVGLENVMTID